MLLHLSVVGSCVIAFGQCCAFVKQISFCRLAHINFQILLSITVSIMHFCGALIFFCFMVPFKLQDMLGPEQVQNYDGLYGQGPPSVHSSHGGRQYQQTGKCSTKTLIAHTHGWLWCALRSFYWTHFFLAWKDWVEESRNMTIFNSMIYER